MKQKFRLFDMHCDTAIEIYRIGADLYDNDLQISLNKADVFGKYIQLAAFFTYPDLSDEDGWQVFLAALENFKSQCEKHGVRIIKTSEELSEFDKSDEKFAVIPAVEDARILCGKLDRVQEMYDLGVRVATLLWGGNTCIGGSHDTDDGLTEFGKAAVREMAKVGIIPDISHASFKSTDEIMDICEECGVSPVATHMNSYTERGHSRNLTDERYIRLNSLGGVAGISLCPPHLTDTPDKSSADDVLRHILRYRSINKYGVGFGCDYDGTRPPADLCDISRLPTVAEKLYENGLSNDEIDRIYYGNVFDFMMKNLPHEGK